MYADLNSRIRFNDQFPTQKLIAVIIAHDKATTGLATKSESSIRLPKDLEGKRIAAPQGDGSRQLFPLFASLNKLNESSITWINVAPELRETMLLRGEAGEHRALPDLHVAQAEREPARDGDGDENSKLRAYDRNARERPGNHSEV